MTDAAITGLCTLGGSALVGSLAYLQGLTTRRTERDRRLRDERKQGFARVLSAMTRAQNDFVKLQADPNWHRLPAAQRYAEVREIRHAFQESVFGALLVAERQDTLSTLALVNEQVFQTGELLVAHPENAPEVIDVGPVITTLHRDLNGRPLK